MPRPYHRRIVPLDADGEEVPEEIPVKVGFSIGDAVSLNGRVIEIQTQKGIQASIKVQFSNGSMWVKATDL